MAMSDPNARSSAISPRLIRVKEDRSGVSHVRSMVSALLRLLAAISLTLMPLGMAQAGTYGPRAAVAAENGQCGEHRQPAEAPAGMDRHCAACAAVPALDPPFRAAEPAPAGPLSAEPVDLLLGLELDVATPPPKKT
jgi:hypothetical protein